MNNWNLNICDVIIVAVQQKVPTALNIFPYKEMSPLYLLYGEYTYITRAFVLNLVIVRTNDTIDDKQFRIILKRKPELVGYLPFKFQYLSEASFHTSIA